MRIRKKKEESSKKVPRRKKFSMETSEPEKVNNQENRPEDLKPVHI